ncbi:MAG: thioredoxin family protein [Alistipes sp.]|nr:thioredoxin family protein [Alistipes sp.]
MLLFYLKNCPFCRKALAYIAQAQKEYPELARVEIDMVEESEQADVADRYDYYYVPAFYIGDQKVHEGGITYEQTVAVLRRALQR